MKRALLSSAWAIGFISIALAGCERNASDRRVDTRTNEPSATERRAEDNRTLAERRADEAQSSPNTSGPSIGGGPREHVTTTTGADAVAKIATARCDREVRCKHVGAKEKYKSRTDCTADMKKDKMDDLNSEACPGGISSSELAKCLQSIKDEDCGNPLDAIGRLNACRSGNLCVK